MDEFTSFNAKEVKEKVEKAMETGAWMTFSFKNTICSIGSLVRNNVITPSMMNPENISKYVSGEFRMIFVSQKLEYPKSMLDD